MNRIPWSIYQSFTPDPKRTGGSTCRINDADGSILGYISDRSNAEMLVQAVNEYSALIAAKEEAEENLELMKQEHKKK